MPEVTPGEIEALARTRVRVKLRSENQEFCGAETHGKVAGRQMKTKLMAGSLTEELAALGVPGLTEDNMARIANGPGLSESGSKKKGGNGNAPEEPEDDEESEEDDDDEEEYDESRHDPYDGPFVTKVLFNRIMDLPFESLDGDQIDLIIEGLKVKKVPRNVKGIAEQAEMVARKLMDEAIAKRTRRSRAHSMSKKASYQCPPGMRKDPGDPSGKRCVRSVKAAGGAGALARIRRKTKKWSKSGAGKKSAKISKRWAERRPSQNSDFAVELEHLLSENQERVDDVRSEILGRIDNIVEMLVDEFDDAAVLAVFNEAIEPIAASYEAGRLDEDVMNVDTFLAEIRPVMTIISKSLDRIERSDLGNA